MKRYSYIAIDREFINIAVRIQLIQCKENLDWDEIYEDTMTLQELSCGDISGIPHTCQTCGEPAEDYTTHTISVIDVYMGQGPVAEESYHCKLCRSMLAYWAYGSFEPRI